MATSATREVQKSISTSKVGPELLVYTRPKGSQLVMEYPSRVPTATQEWSWLKLTERRAFEDLVGSEVDMAAEVLRFASL